MWIVVIILILHLLCMTVLFFVCKAKMLWIDIRTIPMLVCLPIVAEVAALVVEISYRCYWISPKEIGLDKLKSNDEMHRNLLHVDEVADEEVIPVEEAFLINDTHLRRELILDLLKKNPEQYMELLQQARLNDDVDVAHYASTAIMELNHDYDIRMQQMEKLYAQDPSDALVLGEYLELLEEYLKRKLSEGQREQVLRRQYSELLKKNIDLFEERKDYEKLVENELELKDYGTAFWYIERMRTRWPDKEAPWLLLIRYYAKQGEGQAIAQVIKEIHNKQIYLSQSGKEVVEFWESAD